mmetsp:Transcript_8663/g.11998  ORF Transcript_8663/g.11998 Transcript_8663/m.11998 type:complete len:307 (-) Transcript_8663:1099-2019(-)
MRSITLSAVPLLAATSLLAQLASAFTTPSFAGRTLATKHGLSMSYKHNDISNIESFDPLGLSSCQDADSTSLSPAPGALAASAALLFTSVPAYAAGPDWGIFEGRTGSLLHPIAMGSMLLLSLSTALLGFNWRRQRTLGDDITALKKNLPDLGGASSISEAISNAQAAENVDTAFVAKLNAAIPVEKEVATLVAERKELSSQGNRDKHFSQGALLAFIGTAFAIEGPLNTYARAGKLFPGPHLYAGAGLVVLWAAAAACVPAMQKGNDTARTIHIAANLSGIGLFVWQVVSGLPILFKVVELTKWP